MLTITVTIPPGLIGSSNFRAWQNVMPRFAHDAGQLILDAVRSLLGTSQIYTLSPEYSVRKQKLKQFRRIPGKDPDQPLILSATGIYWGLSARKSGNSLVIDIDPSAGINPRGFDYAEFWEKNTHYLEQGLAMVEPQLADLLTDIIVQEMAL